MVAASGKRAAPRRALGFTLIELMLTITIVGMMAAAVGPALGEMMADNRQSSAANTVLQLGRRLRSEALATGHPQLLRYLRNSSNGLGVLEVYAGMGSSCLRTPWAQAFAAPGGDARRPYEVLDMAIFNPTVAGQAPTSADQRRQVIRARAFLPVTTLLTTSGTQLCVQRNGQTYTSTSATGALARQADALMLDVFRSMNGAARGVSRQIIFPVGGSPRWRL